MWDYAHKDYGILESSYNNSLRKEALLCCIFVLLQPIKHLYMEERLNFGGSSGSIISVKEARKLLGSKYSSVPDEIVELIISDMNTLASKLIDWQNGSTKSKGVV